MIAFVCSPYAGDEKNNTELSEGYCRQLADQGYVPFAPHLCFLKYLGDEERRSEGISAGIKIMLACDEVHIFGTSAGVAQEHAAALRMGKPVIWHCDQKTGEAHLRALREEADGMRCHG